MFYSIIVFIFVILFLIKTDRSNPSSRCIIALLISYMFALSFLALYLSKDTYYYDTANHYFSLPKFIWRGLLLLPVQKSTIIRLCNLSVLSTLYCCLLFSLSFKHTGLVRITPAVKRGTAVLLLVELAAYDPAVIRLFYTFLYPRFLTVQEFNACQDRFHTLTTGFHVVLLLACACFLGFTIVRTACLRIIRMSILWISLSWLFIMFSFISIFYHYPLYMIRVSRLSGVITYLTAPLSSNSILYTFFPYFVILMLLLISVSIYNSKMLNYRLREKDFSISKQIAASDITSRTFCHYMKNELLAISAELDNLDLQGESLTAVQNVVERCDHLYERLDQIHRSTKSAVLTLHRENLGDVMTRLSDEYLSQYPDIHLTCQFDSSCPAVMIDSNYFAQAILNILTNAVEALEKVPPERRSLFLSLDSVDNWVVLTIRDTGVGIPAENLPDIFTPFYTSEPVARHWGIGLSLTHKIISAHEGYIEAESTPGEGTTFQIMLPAVSE